MGVSTIGDSLFTKTQQRVLRLLFGTPDKSFYTNEVVRRAGMGRGTVCRELERLTAAGLLVTSRTGNQRHYQANHDNPIFDELLAIVRKTFGVADVVGSALQPIDAKIQYAFVYGSMAKASDAKSSDIDLMLIGDDLVYSEVVVLLMPLEESLQREINPSIYTLKDLKAKLGEENSFLNRVMEQPKLVIKGVIDDLGKSATD